MNDAQTAKVEQPDSDNWITRVATALGSTYTQHQGKDYTQLKCRMIQRRITLIHPHGLEQSNPLALSYLQDFAEKNGLRVLEERRKDEVEPLYECRKQEPPILALGVGMLLQQTGLVGSSQLHLADDNQGPQVSGERFIRLLKIGEQTCQQGKQVRLRANRFLLATQATPTQLNGYASKVVKGTESRIFSYFDAPDFHAIGYTQTSSFVFHVFAGGGSLEACELWGPLASMTREPLHFRLFHSENSKVFGLLYTSYALDLSSSADNKAFWRHQALPIRQTAY